jgi:cobalt-zinc-cadmium efflux system protein
MSRASDRREGRGWPGFLFGGRVRTSTVALLIAFFGLRLAARARAQHDVRYTFGLRRIEILAALTNGFLLIGICIYIVI